MKRLQVMTDVAFDTAITALRKGKQVCCGQFPCCLSTTLKPVIWQAMVFVHSRKDTTKTARDFRTLATQRGLTALLFPFGPGGLSEDGPSPLSGVAGASLRKDLERSRNQDVKDLLNCGLGSRLQLLCFGFLMQ